MFCDHQFIPNVIKVSLDTNHCGSGNKIIAEPTFLCKQFVEVCLTVGSIVILIIEIRQAHLAYTASIHTVRILLVQDVEYT